MKELDAISKNVFLGVVFFIWLNVVMLRAFHCYQDIPYQSDVLWNDPTVQMAISILWSLCALAIMKISRLKKNRQIWVVGASLLGLVVFKLFAKDLDGHGTLSRVVSFIVVGALMTLIGYLAPMPAKEKSEPSQEGNYRSKDVL